MVELSPLHDEALRWFADHNGDEIGWPQPMPGGQLLAIKPKGIYRPAGWSHALSIRVIPDGSYPDERPTPLPGGRWRFRYHQEERKNQDDPTLFKTNAGLSQCRKDGVPIGVLWQTRASPNPRYEVMGLGSVVGWEDGFFVIEGPTSLLTVEDDASVEDVAGPVSAQDARQRVLMEITRRRGQSAFRQKLLNAYERRCAISNCDAEAVLEAAHIVPYRGDHTNVASNGLLLRSDLHTLFDLNLIRIDGTTLSVVVDPSLAASEYGRLDGSRLRVPKVTADRPDAGNFRLRDEMLAMDNAV
jgi:putative restriction endonuclease